MLKGQNFFASGVMYRYAKVEHLNISTLDKQYKHKLARLGRNFDNYPGFQVFFTLGKHFAPECM